MSIFLRVLSPTDFDSSVVENNPDANVDQLVAHVGMIDRPKVERTFNIVFVQVIV